MAVQERAGFLKFNDENGDVNLLLPITTVDNIDGMDEIQEDIANSLKIVPQTLTETQKAQARENIGITPDMFEGIVVGPVTSWNDITDKPFGNANRLIKELNGVFSTVNPYATVYDVSKTTLTVGKTYIVTWNGVEYTTTCAIADDIPAIGNLDAVTGVGDNGMPFLIGRDELGLGLGYPGWIVMSTTGALGEEFTASIYYNGFEYLDNKYLSILNYSPPVDDELLPTTTFENFSFDNSYGAYTKNGPESYSLTIGEEYDVTWDGVTYKCVAQDISVAIPNGIALGNAQALASVFAGNNEPFIIGVVVGSGGVLYASLTDTESGGSHTVSITQHVKDAEYKINPEYLPEEEPDPVPSVTTADNGKFLQVVDGVWTAVTIDESGFKTYLDEYVRSALEGDY